MPTVAVYNTNGEQVGQINLKQEVFGVDVRKDILHRVVTMQLANKRVGTASTKTRSEVRGGGIKPWRQKGTGRARHGSIRSPIWTGGGIVFGPHPKSYRISIPKKIKRLAMKSALSSKVVDNEIIVLDEIQMDQPKTREFVKILNNLNVTDKALVVLANKDENVEKSARNIPGVKTTLANTLNVYDILNCGRLILTKGAVEKVEEVYA
jgi:large subunit ribosomal protein L4